MNTTDNMAKRAVHYSGARARLRDVTPDVHIGDYLPGPKNSITDVPGVLAHTQELHSEDGRVNTGVTTILHRKDWFKQACYAGVFRFNGAGELTGSHWIEETGLLHSPIVLTNSFAVGGAYQGIYKYAIASYTKPGDEIDWFLLPVVGETFDGYLNDLSIFSVKPDHIVHGIESANSDPVREGNTGGGTGMICSGHKGGTGSSSRVVPGLNSGPGGKDEETTYTVAALVQANYGKLQHLRIASVPVGRILADVAKDAKDGSIIIVIATDAPLHPMHCQRLAKRATVGLSRIGGHGHTNSGDIFIAFSTANKILSVQTNVDPLKAAPLTIEVIDDQTINGLLQAAADAAEEAICNALCMAETMTGNMGHTIEALDLEKLKDIMDRYMYVGNTA